MNRRRRQPGAGYTVVEVMLAMLIFSIGIMAVYSLQVVTISNLSEARDVSDGTNLASRIMEQFQSCATTWRDGQPVLMVPDPEKGCIQQISPDWAQLYQEPVNRDGLRAGLIKPPQPPRFCVNYRMAPLDQNASAYHVQIRVMWPRQEGTPTKFAACPVAMGADANLPYVRRVDLIRTIPSQGL